MMKTIADLILKIIGWRIDVTLPQEKKYLIIGAPHTTNWDLPMALLCFWSIRQPFRWVAKKQIFIGPLHYFFTALGGIPVDRSASTGFIRQIAKRFEEQEKMVLAIAPEGTRSASPHWKTGFYYIAREADVPIYLGYIDYAEKCLGYRQVLHPSGDIEKDFETIRQFYRDKVGKYPRNQGPISIRK